MQRNWIGRSEGARVRFPIQGANDSIEVFTTRIDTIFGATFMMLAPEHGLVTTFAKESEDEKGFLEKAQRFRAQDRAGRLTGEVAKEGFFTGRFAINPYTNLPIPIWVANYVLGEYGTGAVMGVPAHDERDFEFAAKYQLPIVPVSVRSTRTVTAVMAATTSNDGVLCQLRQVRWARRRAGAQGHHRRRGRTRHRPGHRAVPVEGLGYLPPAVLGHAHPDDSLPGRRHRAGAGRATAGRAAESGGVHRPRRLAAGQPFPNS